MDKKKRLKKIESLEIQIEKHKEKLKSYEGKNYTLADYWEKEIEQFEEAIEEEKDKLDE
jgi:vacuolar-type H+-ATPase subunit I/STV1